MNTPELRGVIVRLVAFTAVIALMVVGVVMVIKRPVSGTTDSYAATFTDVSGLHLGDDVRMYGLSVGKVRSIDLDGTNARVEFSVQRAHPIFAATTLAIRYQNLAGQRYVDIRQPDTSGSPLRGGATIPLERTTPSFDITSLFNGMEPVLAELSPAEVNKFFQNAIAVIEGDKSAVGATMNAIGTLSDYVTDRQTVISTLLGNFQAINQQIGGKSESATLLIKGVSDVFVNLQKQMVGLLDFSSAAPPVLGPLNTLMAAIGLTQPTNPDISKDLKLLLPDTQAAADFLGRLPGLVQSLASALPPAAATPLPACSRGEAEPPPALQILIGGQKVRICNR